jgi:crotonobetainyl-CoA hydratase
MEVALDANAVLRERRGNFFYITLNRPAALNAINLDLTVGMYDAIEEFKADREAFIAIITGNGRAFCAGADLKDMVVEAGRSQEERIARAQVRREKGDTIMRTQRCWKPIIAAVNGLALGGGFEIAMSTDIIVAASDIRLGLPEVKRGILPGIGIFKLHRQVPYKIAMQIMLTGEDRMTAQRGYEIGIVNQVVPVQPDWSDDQKQQAVVEAATAMAERMMDGAPLALQGVKEAVHRSRHLPQDDAMWLNFDHVFRNSLDSLEGPRAFAEKRRPVWQNR